RALARQRSVPIGAFWVAPSSRGRRSTVGNRPRSIGGPGGARSGHVARALRGRPIRRRFVPRRRPRQQKWHFSQWFSSEELRHRAGGRGSGRGHGSPFRGLTGGVSCRRVSPPNNDTRPARERRARCSLEELVRRRGGGSNRKEKRNCPKPPAQRNPV